MLMEGSLEVFYTEDEMKGLGKIPMTFIRAPYIADVYGNAETLAVVDGKVVAARQENQLATAFHPELNDDTSVHEYFVQMIKEVRHSDCLFRGSLYILLTFK